MNTQQRHTLAFIGNVTSLVILFACSYTLMQVLTAKNDRQIDAERFELCQNDPKTTICV
ncbi:MAG: hypothetical protein ACEQSC_00160 [Candidatus Nanopelagicaceae bacterium]